MPDLLLELVSEEIPARMQARAADDLRKLVTDALVAAGFLYEGARAYATPRRLTLHVVGLPARGSDVREERRGPRVGAPDAALAGFLKSVGLSSRDELGIRSDPKKGDVYVATVERLGRPTAEIVAEIVPEIIRAFPWPKSMRWGPASERPGSLRWVRPLQSILCTFGDEVETPEIVPFEVDGIVSGDLTRGHRFMAPGAIAARRFEDYVAALHRARVVLDPERRRDIIRHDARDLAFAQGLEVIEDEGLLAEVAGLVEWPVTLIGTFDPSFLAIPPEVIRATIRANQKCFVLRTSGSSTQDGSPGELANKFVIVANIEATDGGAKIVAGNERVVRARLSDAKFFWESDLKPLPSFAESRLKPLDQRLDRLKSLDIVFHEKLGTQAERIERIAALARELAPPIGADPDLAERAARLAKADLVTEMVGEFPELQGLMGRYYAAAQGEHPSVAAAIEEHYRPLGPSDRVPTDPVAVAVALADKIDTLVGFWAIDEKPTGSKDPYALRRAALGVIRLVLENGVRLRLGSLFVLSFAALIRQLESRLLPYVYVTDASIEPRSWSLSTSENNEHLKCFKVEELFEAASKFVRVAVYPRTLMTASEHEGVKIGSLRNVLLGLNDFFRERLKGYLRDKGTRHDLIDAVLGAAAPLRHAEEARDAPSRSTADDRASFETPASRAPQDDEPGGLESYRSSTSDPRPACPDDDFGVSGLVQPANDDLLMIVRRVEALGWFLATEDGRSLLAGYKRAANILRIEEKKDGRSFDEMPDVGALVADEERALAVTLARASGAASEAVRTEDFEGAMRALAELRPALDAFFENVIVNAEDPALRENRLRLLNMFRRATREVADFGRIEG